MYEFKMGRLFVIGGIRKKTRGKKPTCQICEKTILENEEALSIKAIGEYERSHHYKCLMKLFNKIKKQRSHHYKCLMKLFNKIKKHGDTATDRD